MAKAMGQRVYRRGSGRKAELGKWEKRRLVQLGACLVLFLLILLTRGTGKLDRLKGELSDVLRKNVDMGIAVTDAHWAVSSKQGPGVVLSGAWKNLFFPAAKAAPSSWKKGITYRSAREGLLKGEPPIFSFCPKEEKQETEAADLRQEENVPVQPVAEETAEAAVIYVPYNGPELPEHTTMDRCALELDETVTPLLGKLTSEFGWREHPIEGGEKFHCGVDLKADSGTPVLAFAAGTVDYIGESDIYGQYLQLRHNGGVTSFYAHCSKLCVQQGQKVNAGEKVAESGATGEVTGPHLHFEMKKDGVRLNPAYYIETLA